MIVEGDGGDGCVVCGGEYGVERVAGLGVANTAGFSAGFAEDVDGES